MGQVKLITRVFFIALIIVHTISKPHYSKKSLLKRRHKREEIMPPSLYFNPGSQEKARLDFEEQHSETPDAAFGAPEAGHFVGQQDLTSMKETSAFTNQNDAAEFHNRFLEQSEVQRSSFAYSPQTADQQYSQNYMRDMPAGYAAEDGAKKSLVAKQNLPFNEPHPEGQHQHVTDDAILTHYENNSWSGVSRFPPTRVPTVENSTNVVAGLSLPAGGRPASYSVQVSGDTNNGYTTTASKVEATYPAAPTKNESTQNQANNETKTSASNEKNATQQIPSYVEYVVPPPSQIFDQSEKPLAKEPVYQTNQGENQKQTSEGAPVSQQPPQKEPTPVIQTYPAENPKQTTAGAPVSQQPPQKVPLPIIQTNPADISKQPGVETSVYPQQTPIAQKPVALPATSNQNAPSEAEAAKLNQSPAQTAPKIPSAKNYPIDLIWLGQSRKTGLKVVKTATGNQLVSENQESANAEKKPEPSTQNAAQQQQQISVQQQQQPQVQQPVQPQQQQGQTQASQQQQQPQIQQQPQTNEQQQQQATPVQQQQKQQQQPTALQQQLSVQQQQQPAPIQSQQQPQSTTQQQPQSSVQQQQQQPSVQQQQQVQKPQQAQQQQQQPAAQQQQPQASQQQNPAQQQQQQQPAVQQQQQQQVQKPQQTQQQPASQQQQQPPTGQQKYPAQQQQQQQTQAAQQQQPQIQQQPQAYQQQSQPQTQQQPQQQQTVQTPAAGQSVTSPAYTQPTSNQDTQDHPMCPQYPISRCGEAWIIKNCRYRCRVYVESSTAVPMKSPYQTSQTTVADNNTSCTAKTTGGNSNNGCCVFPFIYRGIPYYSCVLQPGQSYWCSTTYNFDKDGRWGFCGGCPVPPCPATTPAATTSTPPTTQPTTTQATTTQATTAPATTTQATTTQATTTQATTTQATTTPATTTQATTPQTTTTQATTTQATTTQATTTQATTTQATTTQATTTQATTTQATTTQATTTQATTTQATTKQASTTPAYPFTTAAPPQKVCGPWSTWTQCDKNCGGGQQYRYRNCTKTISVNEVEVEHQPCNSHSCSMVCGNWTQWSECSASCGYGYRQRFRNCTLNGELKVYVDRKSCYVNDCPPVCDEWSAWSTCSKSCDGGLQQRRRNCTITDGLQSVTQIFSENRLCNTEPCGPDCEQWSAWTPCTKSCGEGTQYRYTNCTSKEGENKMYYDHRVCNTQACPPVCGKWHKWSECTKTCDGGSQHRTRNCTVEDQGKNETFSEGEVQECNTQPCEPVCGQWTSWSECTKTCGGGDQQRTRNCTLEQQGHNVSYAETEMQDCNTQMCPIVRCGEWSAWSECSKSCGGGMMHRIRHCGYQDQYGNYTYDETENKACNKQACEPSYNCSAWGPWTECTVTCGGGQTTRVRQCVRDDGAILIIPETGYCNIQPCEKVCGQWSSFGHCSVPCGGGTAQRWRTCDGKVETEDSPCNTFPCPTAPPPPSNLTTPAPEVCSAWSGWSQCSATCNGMQTRVRHCKNATHDSDQLEARPCNTLPCENATTTPASVPQTTPQTTPATTPATTPGTTPSTTPQTTPSTTPSPTTPTKNQTTPTTPITTTAPPANCSEWSQWSQCTRTCGGGYQERFKTCQKFDQEVQSRICNTQSCPTPSPAPTTTPKPKPGPFPECLVAYLSFDKVDKERNIVFDEGPYHNDAMLDGNMTFVNGNFSCGSAVSLEGGEILFDGTKFRPKPTVAVTIAAWIYIFSNVQRQTIFATRAGNQESDNFYLEIEQGKIRWYHINPMGKKVFYMVTESLLPEKTWVHVAGSYNVATGHVKFFVNAEESKVTYGEGPLTTDWDSYAKIAGGGTGTKFRGIIDEFYIFNCSLIDEQIRVVADTCKLREGEECPSPLLGVCPPCENCTTAIPPTKKPEEKSMVKAKSFDNSERHSNVNKAYNPYSLESILSSSVQADSANVGRDMLHRTDFLFPWFKSVMAYRKKRRSA